MQSSHVQALQQKHEGLERQIRVELGRPQPDEAMLIELKRQKLRIKDAISGV
jgi:hypothetical protein